MVREKTEFEKHLVSLKIDVKECGCHTKIVPLVDGTYRTFRMVGPACMSMGIRH